MILVLTAALFTLVWYGCVILAWVGCAIIGGAITNGKGRGWGLGVLLGALFTMIGLLIAIALSDVSAGRGSRVPTPNAGTEARSPPHPAPAPRRRHPRGRVIALMWIALFVIGIAVAVVFQDDDPATDEGAGMGAIVGMAGMVLTVLYVVGSLLFEKFRERGQKHSDDEALTPR